MYKWEIQNHRKSFKYHPRNDPADPAMRSGVGQTRALEPFLHGKFHDVNGTTNHHLHFSSCFVVQKQKKYLGFAWP